MKLFLTLIFVFSLCIVQAQVNGHLNFGFGGATGALVQPYDDSGSRFGGSFLVEVEFITDPRLSTSLFTRINSNAKGDKGLFGGLTVDSRTYHFGIKENIELHKSENENFTFWLSPSIAYGFEVAKWKDEGDWFLGIDDPSKGTDRFQLLQLGLFTSLRVGNENASFVIGIGVRNDNALSGKRDGSEFEGHEITNTAAMDIMMGFVFGLSKDKP